MTVARGVPGDVSAAVTGRKPGRERAGETPEADGFAKAMRGLGSAQQDDKSTGSSAKAKAADRTHAHSTRKSDFVGADAGIGDDVQATQDAGGTSETDGEAADAAEGRGATRRKRSVQAGSGERQAAAGQAKGSDGGAAGAAESASADTPSGPATGEDEAAQDAARATSADRTGGAATSAGAAKAGAANAEDRRDATDPAASEPIEGQTTMLGATDEATPSVDAVERQARRALQSSVTTQRNPELVRLRLLQSGLGAENATVELQLSAEEVADRLGISLPGEDDAARQPEVDPVRPRNGRIIVTVGRGDGYAVDPVAADDASVSAKAVFEATSAAPLSPDAKLAAILGGFGLESRIVAANAAVEPQDHTNDVGQDMASAAPRRSGEEPATTAAQGNADIQSHGGGGTTGTAGTVAPVAPPAAAPMAAQAAAPVAARSAQEAAAPAAGRTSAARGAQDAAAAPAAAGRSAFIVPDRAIREGADPLRAAQAAAASISANAAGNAPATSRSAGTTVETARTAIGPRADQPASSRSLGLGARVDLVSMRTDFEPATRRTQRNDVVEAPARASASPSMPAGNAAGAPPRSVLADLDSLLSASSAASDPLGTVTELRGGPILPARAEGRAADGAEVGRASRSLPGQAELALQEATARPQNATASGSASGQAATQPRATAQTAEAPRAASTAAERAEPRAAVPAMSFGTDPEAVSAAAMPADASDGGMPARAGEGPARNGAAAPAPTVAETRPRAVPAAAAQPANMPVQAEAPTPRRQGAAPSFAETPRAERPGPQRGEQRDGGRLDRPAVTRNENPVASAAARPASQAAGTHRASGELPTRQAFGDAQKPAAAPAGNHHSAPAADAARPADPKRAAAAMPSEARSGETTTSRPVSAAEGHAAAPTGEARPASSQDGAGARSAAVGATMPEPADTGRQVSGARAGNQAADIAQPRPAPTAMAPADRQDRPATVMPAVAQNAADGRKPAASATGAGQQAAATTASRSQGPADTGAAAATNERMSALSATSAQAPAQGEGTASRSDDANAAPRGDDAVPAARLEGASPEGASTPDRGREDARENRRAIPARTAATPDNASRATFSAAADASSAGGRAGNGAAPADMPAQASAAPAPRGAAPAMPSSEAGRPASAATAGAPGASTQAGVPDAARQERPSAAEPSQSFRNAGGEPAANPRQPAAAMTSAATAGDGPQLQEQAPRAARSAGGETQSAEPKGPANASVAAPQAARAQATEASPNARTQPDAATSAGPDHPAAADTSTGRRDAGSEPVGELRRSAAAVTAARPSGDRVQSPEQAPRAMESRGAQARSDEPKGPANASAAAPQAARAQTTEASPTARTQPDAATSARPDHPAAAEPSPGKGDVHGEPATELRRPAAAMTAATPPSDRAQPQEQASRAADRTGAQLPSGEARAQAGGAAAPTLAPAQTTGAAPGAEGRGNAAELARPDHQIGTEATQVAAETGGEPAAEPQRPAAAATGLTAERAPRQEPSLRSAERSAAAATDDFAKSFKQPASQSARVADGTLGETRQGMFSASTAQVANAVATALVGMDQQANAPVGAERTRLRAGGAALKTIQIQLAPENLGKVNITLKLIGGNLAVHIEATEPETAHRLKDDSEGLKSLLKSAGFDVDEAIITLGSRDAAGVRAAQQPGAPNDASASGQPRGEGSANGQPSSGDQQGQGGRRDDGRSRQPQVDPISRSLDGAAESRGRNMALDPSVYL